MTIQAQVDLAKAFKISGDAVSKLWNQTADKKKMLHEDAARLRALPKKRAKAAKRKVRVQVIFLFMICFACVIVLLVLWL